MDFFKGSAVTASESPGMRIKTQISAATFSVRISGRGSQLGNLPFRKLPRWFLGFLHSSGRKSWLGHPQPLCRRSWDPEPSRILYKGSQSTRCDWYTGGCVGYSRNYAKRAGEIVKLGQNVGHLASFVQHTRMTTFGERDVLNAAAVCVYVCVIVVGGGRVCCWSDDKKWKTWDFLDGSMVKTLHFQW